MVVFEDGRNERSDALSLSRVQVACFYPYIDAGSWEVVSPPLTRTSDP